MPTIKYIEANGTEHQVDVPVGDTLMEGAIDNDIDAIVADCGGSCCCATCHCYIDEAWLNKTGEAEEHERDMLEMVQSLAPNSRLSCQITVTEQLEGLVVRLPASQYE